MNFLNRTQDHDVEVFKKLNAIVNEAALDDILHCRIPTHQLRPQDTQALEDFLEAISHIGTSYRHSLLRLRSEQLTFALYRLRSVIRRTYGPLPQKCNMLRSNLGHSQGYYGYYNGARIELDHNIDTAWRAYEDYRTAIKDTLPVFSEQGYQEQRKNPRRSVRENVALPIIVSDKAGLASGQVIDMTMRGCGLRFTKPLKPGQYLTFKVNPDDGTTSVQCDVARVQWVVEDRAGVVFLWMLREHDRRLRQLCDDRLLFEFAD